MVISHNLTAMNAQRQYNIVDSKRAKSTEKLSSGYKINRAADDAAGLAISEKMRRQIRGLSQGAENIQDGTSACQIMDGALNETMDIMSRITELSVKAANGTLDDEDRRSIQHEITQLLSELNRTTKSCNFNEKNLLSVDSYFDNPRTNPNAGKADIVFVLDNTGSMDSFITNVKNNLASFSDKLKNCNIQYGFVAYGDTDSTPAVVTYPFVDTAAKVKAEMDGMTMTWGGDGPEQALEGIMAAANYSFRSDAASKNIILVTDANYHVKGDGAEYNYTPDDIKTTLAAKGITMSVVTRPEYMSLYSGIANGSVHDIFSNFNNSLSVIAGDIVEEAGEEIFKNPEDLRIQCSGESDDYIMVHTYNINTDTLDLTNLNVETKESAQKAIDAIDSAAKYVSNIRSNIGAEQNRLEHATNINENVIENTTSAESQIRDTDMAKEMVSFSLNNILAQAGQSMLAQANQSNQGVLALLQ